MSNTPEEIDVRTLGLLGATGVGVGAIVGGGIFVLAGVAFATAGPAAILAFGINGIVAFLTAMSLAELSSAFPQNGGVYVFAKKVLSVRSAFAIGWILWSAYIVAGVLYALGFASFAELALDSFWEAYGASPPGWLHGRSLTLLLASGATIFYAISLARKSTGGGQWATFGKIAVFVVLLVAGLWALVQQDTETTVAHLTPFVDGGMTGLLMATGVTLIALQGFDLIAAVGGEVKDPGRTIPRAMFLSLGCALAIYLPLLLVVASVGVEPGSSIRQLAMSQPERIIPLAAERFMGPIGYWLVVVAAILSTLSALHANLLAASRIALTMSRDRTLPSVLGVLDAKRETPIAAVFTSALALIAIIFMVPNLADAGAAASLIFLIAFALSHATVYLARVRGGTSQAPFKTPWFPLVPILGGGACAVMAVFQAVTVPDAAGISLLWLALGVLLYWSLFAHRAQIGDAASEGYDAGLLRLRGQSPVVLVPIANPEHAKAMMSVANTLAAQKVWRVLLLSIVRVPEEPEAPVVSEALASAQQAIGEALIHSYDGGAYPDALIIPSAKPLEEIGRIAEEYRCSTVLLGIGDLDAMGETAVDSLLNGVDADLALMTAEPEWRLASATRILVPIGGRGEQHELRARILGSICRSSPREVTFLRVLGENATANEIERARLETESLAGLHVRGKSKVTIVVAKDSSEAVLEAARDSDLMIIGLESVGWKRKVFGRFALKIANEATCATLFLSRRSPRALELLEPLRNDVVHSVKGVLSTH